MKAYINSDRVDCYNIGKANGTAQGVTGKIKKKDSTNTRWHVEREDTEAGMRATEES